MNSSPSSLRSHYAAAWLLGLSALLLIALSACGAGSPGAGRPQPTRPPGGGLTILPCPGAYTSATPPVAILGDKENVTEAKVRVGDAIEVHMDIGHVWKLDGVTPSGALAVKNENGLFDRAAGDCVWRFQASAPGSATITFTGRALCDPTQVCPQYIMRQSYTVTAS